MDIPINYTNENSIFFTMARMNPPTPGHLNIIEQLIKDANAKGVTHVYVILSNTNNNNENPIPCPEKIVVLEEVDDTTKTMIHALKQNMQLKEMDDAKRDMIKQTQVYTICTKEGENMFRPIINIVRDMGNVPQINLFVVIGEDREDMVDSITNFFFKMDNVNSIAKDFLPRVDMASYKKMSNTPEGLNELLDKVAVSKIVEDNAMSASLVRNIVKNKRKDKFDELYSPYLDQVKIDTLYSSIQSGLNRLGPNDKPSSKPTPLIYTYPMIKGISTFPIKSLKIEKTSKVETPLKVKRILKAKKTSESPNIKDLSTSSRSIRSRYKIPSYEYQSLEKNPIGGGITKRMIKKRGKTKKNRRTKKRTNKRRTQYKSKRLNKKGKRT